MAHSVKIEDELYDKLSLYCNENGLKINVFCNSVLKEKLMLEMYGDAPFLVEATPIKADTTDANGRVYPKEVLEKAVEEFNKNRQNSQETPVNFDKNTDKTDKSDKYHDENGHFILTPMTSEDGEKELTRILMENQDQPMTEEQKEKLRQDIKQETENLKNFIEATPSGRPSKRRL